MAMVSNEVVLPPRGILEVLGRVLLVVTMGYLLVFCRRRPETLDGLQSTEPSPTVKKKMRNLFAILFF